MLLHRNRDEMSGLHGARLEKAQQGSAESSLCRASPWDQLGRGMLVTLLFPRGINWKVLLVCGP